MKIIRALILFLGAAGMAAFFPMGVAAYYAPVKEMKLDFEKQGLEVGDDISVKLMVESGYLKTQENTLAKIDGVKAIICFNNTVEIEGDPEKAVILNEENGFNRLVLAEVKDGCLNLGVSSDMEAAKLKSGVVEVADITFKLREEGQTSIWLETTKARVGGHNPITLDKALYLGDLGGIGRYDFKVNYRITYWGIYANDLRCMTNWPAKVGVVAAGETTAFVESVPEFSGRSQGKWAQFEGTAYIKDAKSKEGVGVLIKGMKHLMSKYGKDGQTEYYNAADGEINITDEERVYDFGYYPQLAGDVTGEEGVPDGYINGIDFSYVKTRANHRETIEEGGNMMADLDGNCLCNGMDISYLMIGLNTWYDQLY